MNPRLRLLTFLFFLLLIVVSGPLEAQGHLVEFQIKPPKINVIIDDPDPTHTLRLRQRYVVEVVDHVWLFGSPDQAEPATPLVAWSRRTDSGHDVVVSRYERDAFRAPAVVAGTLADERDPRLAQDPRDGTVHLVYWIDGDAPVVVHRTAAADLSSWSEPEVISAPGERAARPSVAIRDGVVHVVYESLGPADVEGSRLIVLAKQVERGFTREVLAATSCPLPAWPSLHVDGARTWVDWVDDAGTIAWRGVLAGGLFQPIGREPFDGPLDRDLARGRIALRAGR